MRLYSALDIDWTTRDDDVSTRVWVLLDDFHPIAIDEHESGLRAFFATAASRDSAAAALQELTGLTTSAVEVPDENWAERSQASLAPVRVGAIVVAPPWAAEPGDLVIQPSMGFGTGHHASTRLCLRLLQQIDLTNRSVLDVGTGSGVLALAAWKLGARPVAAIDHDPDALTSGRESAGLNGASGAIDFQLADLDLDPEWPRGRRYHVVLANLTGGLIERVARRLAQAANGHVIASGIMVSEGQAVIGALEAAGLQLADRVEEDEWIGVRLTSPTSSTAR